MKKWVIYLLAIQSLALGIVLNTRTNLGVAAFSSIFYAISQITGISLGTASMLLYFILIIVQIILLRKITLPIILEIPFSMVFGLLTDLYNTILPHMELSIITSLLLLALALTLTSIGVYFTVRCQIVANPVDACVQTISSQFQKPLSITKNCFDLSMILITIIMCLVLRQPIYGIGIGTIISALVVGRIISVWQKLFDEKMNLLVNEKTKAQAL